MGSWQDYFTDAELAALEVHPDVLYLAGLGYPFSVCLEAVVPGLARHNPDKRRLQYIIAHGTDDFHVGHALPRNLAAWKASVELTRLVDNEPIVPRGPPRDLERLTIERIRALYGEEAVAAYHARRMPRPAAPPTEPPRTPVTEQPVYTPPPAKQNKPLDDLPLFSSS